MSRVDGNLTELPSTLLVDNNWVVCQAAKHPNNHTCISLITPKNAWKKKLVISADNVFGYKLKCGDKWGEPMSGLNHEMKVNMVDLGEDCGHLAIQFIKSKTFGIMSDYGTLTLPESLRGYVVAFFWPNDAPGDHWNHFINILEQTQNATGKIAGVSDNVVKVGTNATQFLALFGI
ncbi:hypothetical protein Poli38472_007568 [Pythium oligandrum]|uniref:Uncharacterized protein n=1 Tax=Pythium oligandrum TaxID=41045 RepID=A0A8K1CQE2_PYTOL|nr:hypothetical protein Poli38472_007568 [Pythium oligandrum]|eukprot:TMW67896.1 hypothetical protein Poli38472_007568 [Pythium oligandrum]